MDSNLVARVNVEAYCPQIRKKRKNVHSHVGCPKPSVWEMEIIVYPLLLEICPRGNNKRIIIIFSCS